MWREEVKRRLWTWDHLGVTTFKKVSGGWNTWPSLAERNVEEFA